MGKLSLYNKLRHWLAFNPWPGGHSLQYDPETDSTLLLIGCHSFEYSMNVLTVDGGQWEIPMGDPAEAFREIKQIVTG